MKSGDLVQIEWNTMSAGIPPLISAFDHARRVLRLQTGTAVVLLEVVTGDRSHYLVLHPEHGILKVPGVGNLKLVPVQVDDEGEPKP